MAKIADREVSTNDLGLMGAAIATFIFSLLPWFGVSIAGFSAHRNGWGVGFLAWFPILLSIAIGVLIALRVFAAVQLPTLPAGWGFIVLAAAGLALVLVLLKLLIGYHSTDRKIGLYLGLIAIAVQTYFAFAAFKLSGESLPGGRTL